MDLVCWIGCSFSIRSNRGIENKMTELCSHLCRLLLLLLLLLSLLLTCLNVLKWRKRYVFKTVWIENWRISTEYSIAYIKNSVGIINHQQNCWWNTVIEKLLFNIFILLGYYQSPIKLSTKYSIKGFNLYLLSCVSKLTRQ
jgi:hypothetical protein